MRKLNNINRKFIKFSSACNYNLISKPFLKGNKIMLYFEFFKKYNKICDIKSIKVFNFYNIFNSFNKIKTNKNIIFNEYFNTFNNFNKLENYLIDNNFFFYK